MRSTWTLVVSTMLLVGAAPERTATEAPFKPTMISDVAERVTPAVVNITTRRARALPSGLSLDPSLRELINPESKKRLPPGLSAGSGVVISSDGFIITNNHVVEGADSIRVTFADRREYEARLIGTDKPSDLALIKIDVVEHPAVPFGDSAKLRLGEIVLAIGNPFGIGQTVTMGIVSAKDRANVGIVKYEDFIQTDASINPGNSGGALVNLDGELVGINTAIVSRSGGTQGIGFAVPSNMVKPILSQIREHGRVRRGWLGIVVQDLTPEIAESLELASTVGVLVSDVVEAGPASKAALKVGDVIVELGGQRTTSASDLRNTIALMRPGTNVTLRVLRVRRPLDVKVTLAEMEGDEPAAEPRERESEQNLLLGLSLRDLDPASRRRLQVPGGLGGAVVAEVETDSPADRSGLEQEDVIVLADRQPVHSASDFNRLVKRTAHHAVLRVYRGGRSTFLVLKR